jgi:hypothetical protein
MHRIFILSPASTTGKRASLLMSAQAEFELAKKMRGSGAPLGEVFSFLSELYFRGKFTYSRYFGRPPAGLQPQYVITSDAGLMPADELVTLARLKAFCEIGIDPLEPRYAQPFRASSDKLRRQLPLDSEVVLLGSIATNKYVDILVETFGPRLLIPKEFVGRGDMSRGGLLLRAVTSDQELEYVALSAVNSRRGKRPPKLPRLLNGRPKTSSRPGTENGT